jgi:hypothetical protein
VLASLKWHLLLGGLRGTTQQRIQTWTALGFSALFGVLAGAVLAALGRGAAVADDLLVVLLPLTVVGVGLLSAAAGVEASLDARHLANEPITRRALGAGLLAAAAVGPPSLLAGFAGAGIVAGWSGGTPRTLAVLGAVLGWWATLLLFSRTLANVLGAVATGRFRQLAQAGATAAALAVWLGSQLAVRDAEGWTPQRWERLADLAATTPPGQLGRAVAATDAADAALHLLLGVSWLPLLLAAVVWSTGRLAAAAPRPGGGPTRRARGGVPQPLLRRVLPDSPAGVLARRTIRTKVRTPRQAVNTATALCVGAGVFLLGPVLGGGAVDPRVVILGGLLHVAVLFDGNNAFGMDGPAMWVEVAAGADAATLVRAKVLSSLTVMALPALVLPVGLAALSGGWAWLPVAWLVGAGALAASAGVAVLSATVAPFAMPDSPNPLAAGDTGQGCLAGLMLSVCVVSLAVVSAPVAVAVLLASSRSVGLTVLAAAAAPVLGAAVLWGTGSLAERALRGREAEMVERVTPSR